MWDFMLSLLCITTKRRLILVLAKRSPRKFSITQGSFFPYDLVFNQSCYSQVKLKLRKLCVRVQLESEIANEKYVIILMMYSILFCAVLWQLSLNCYMLCVQCSYWQCCACNVVIGTFWQLFAPKSSRWPFPSSLLPHSLTRFFTSWRIFFLKVELIIYLVGAQPFTEETRSLF